MPPNRSIAQILAGGTAKSAGDEFERELEAMHAAWSEEGFAQIQKCGLQVRWIRGQPTVVGKGGVDYLGGVKGRAVAYEAKTRRGEASFRLLDRPATKDRKAQDTERTECEVLRRHTRAGTAAFYLIRDPELNRCYVLRGILVFNQLLLGQSIRLREDLTAGGRALVPALEWASPQALILAIAQGKTLWDWTSIIFPDLSSSNP
jgi:penicillin-binding protein-related factor A (putative recombinase)